MNKKRKIIVLAVMILLTGLLNFNNGVLDKIRTVDIVTLLALGMCIGALISTLSASLKSKG